MADDTKEPVVKQAEKFQPAHEESSKSLAGLADEYFRDLFAKAKIGGKDSDPYSFSGDGKKPGQADKSTDPGKDPYDYSGDGKSDAKSAAAGLQKLFDKAGNPKEGATKTENFQDGKGELRVLPGSDGKPTGQYVGADGKTTTRISENASVEYDPKTQKYTSIDKNGKRTELKDDDKVDPSDKNSKTLKELKQNGVAQEKADGGADGTKTTYLDGRVTTAFKEPSRLSERTTYPPGYRSDDPADRGQNAGLRQVEKYRELKPEEMKPGDTPTSAGGRTVKTFEDRKETSFDKGDISKVTAYKDPDRDHPAVKTDYRNNKGPDGASSVETYKNDGRPDGVKQVAKFHDGNDKETKPDKITYNNGVTLDRPANGDIRRPVGQGDRTGVLDIDKNTGMPSHMQIGDNDYKVTYGPDGKVQSMSVEGKGSPPSHLQMDRDPKTGELKVTTADGKFAPKDGKIDLDGIPVSVKDGKVDGDVSLNKAGDIRSTGPGGPERHEYVRRADGSKEDYDFKNWTRTTTTPDGKVKDPVDRWDGYQWRNDGKPSADGKRVDFPDGTYTQRDTSGNPPKDVTVFGNKDGSTSSYDWMNGKRVDRDTAGKETTSYYDGTSYRQGTETKLPNGDTQITFNPPGNRDQPKDVVHHAKDNSTTNTYQDGTKVEKNPKGQVTDINGPKGSTKIVRDGDGDIFQVQQTGTDGKTTTYQRTGQERDPGMEGWFNHEGNGTPRPPGDAPPRDPNAPKDYNQWKVTTQINGNTSVEYDPTTKGYTRIDKDGTRTAITDDKAKLDPKDPNSKSLGDFKRDQSSGPNADGMNIHTTADGTVRMESAAHDGKPAEVRLRNPVGDNSTETATQKIVDHPGGVKETVDKTKNPPETKVEFERNGKKEALDSKNGPITFNDNGTVEQKSTDGKTTTAYLPDGSTAKYANDGNKQTVTELNIASNDPKNPGKVTTFKPGTDPCKSLEKVGDYFKATMTKDGKDVPTVLDPIGRTKQEQLPGEQFARVSDLSTGKPLGLNTLQGRRLLRYNFDGKSAVGPDGKHTFSGDKWDLDPSHIKVGPNGEAIISGKNGKDQAVLKANRSVVETVDGKDKAYFPNGDSAAYENGKLKTLTMGGKDYDPVLNDKGEVTSLKPKDGSPEIKSVPAGTAYKFTDDGKFVSTSSFDAKDGKPPVNTKTEWKPLTGQARVESSWLAADGKSTITTSFVTDKDGKVTEFSPPGAQAGAVLQRPATYKDGKLTVSMDDKGTTAVINPDGSSDMTIKGQNGAPDQVLHRDRDSNLVPTTDQANNLKQMADAALKGDAATQQKFANELMSRIKTQQDLASFLKALNEGVFKQLGVNVDVKPASDQKSMNVTITKDGKTITIPFALPS